MAPIAPNNSEIMPKTEASKRTGLSVRRLNKAARNGDIAAIIIDGEVLILREPLERMLRGEPASPHPPEDDSEGASRECHIM